MVRSSSSLSLRATYRIQAQRRLRYAGDPVGGRRQHDRGDVPAAVHRATGAQRIVDMDDRYMRGAEEPEVLPHLLPLTLMIAAIDAQRVVELKTALPPAVPMHPAVLPGPRDVRSLRIALARLGAQRAAQPIRVPSPLAIASCQG
jgi:hypothetical protein